MMSGDSLVQKLGVNLMKRTVLRISCDAMVKFCGVLIALALLGSWGVQRVSAQDYDDPPARVARLGYAEGSVSFQPAGENEWVQAVPNRPMTTGDKLWADQNSRAEVQLGSAMIDLAPNTGFSFLNLDDRTVQIELSAGSLNVRVWELDRDNVFEIDTPNQAFSVYQPGRYRVEASENGDYTVVTIREGEGESTGNGQSYTMHAGQRTTFSGTAQLNAEVEQIGGQDDFDNWSYSRERRYDDSPSARYCSRRVVGFEDLDDYGDWQSNSEYGHVWFPRVEAGWAPYHEGHWAWIDPWGWTWVDDDRWGYAPFHYGRWAWFQNRWGWVPGPMEVRPVYAPALVAFVGGGGVAFGANVAWFPLGPREVYVPSYRVSEGYVNRVNVSNTTVNQTTITNVYKTTIVNNNTTITNVNYANRNVQGAVAAVPQAAFASARPVAQSAVAVNARQLASVPVSARAAVPPQPAAVLGAHANTANHVAAPPQSVARRAVIAKAAPPPPVPSFTARQQVLAQHPGQPVARQELQKLAPAAAVASAAAMVKRAPPAKAATATPAPNRANQPANAPAAQPSRPANPTEPRPGANTASPSRPEPAPNRPAANQPTPNRPEANPPAATRPGEPAPGTERPPTSPENRRPETGPTQPRNAEPAPATNRPEPPTRNDRPPAAQPENRPAPNTPANRPAPTPQPNRPTENRPAPNREATPAAPSNRPETNRPETNHAPEPPSRADRPTPQPPANRPAPARTEPSTPPNSRPEPNRAPEQPRNQAQPREQARPAPDRAQPPRTPQAKPAPKEPAKASPEDKKKPAEPKKPEDRPQ